MFVINVCNSILCLYIPVEHVSFVLRFRLIFFRFSAKRFSLTFLRFQTKTKMSGAPRVRRFCLKFFSGSQRKIFPVSNENENERRNPECYRQKRTRTERMSKLTISNSGDSAMMTSEGLKTDNHEQRRWVRLSGFHERISVEIPWKLLILPVERLKLFKPARIFKLLWSPSIDSKEPIPPGYVAWRAGTTNLFLLVS